MTCSLCGLGEMAAGSSRVHQGWLVRARSLGETLWRHPEVTLSGVGAVGCSCGFSDVFPTCGVLEQPVLDMRVAR